MEHTVRHATSHTNRMTLAIWSCRMLECFEQSSMLPHFDIAVRAKNNTTVSDVITQTAVSSVTIGQVMPPDRFWWMMVNNLKWEICGVPRYVEAIIALL